MSNGEEDDHEELLTLSLSTGRRPSPPPLPKNLNGHVILPLPPPMTSPPMTSPPPPPPPYTASSLPHHHHHPYEVGCTSSVGPAASRNGRARKHSTVKIGQGKSETIPAPYPWASTRRAVTLPLKHLLAAGVREVSGKVHCKTCDGEFEIRYDLEQKFAEVAAFVRENKEQMHDRAPAVWMNSVLPDCKHCEQRNCMKPVLGKKRSINWLFLLLGQMIGCCRLSELKYFCKHTNNHRTGAKDRVLYLTYLGICKQLDPDGPFDP